jgi:Family of unknown function (DUF6022)
MNQASQVNTLPSATIDDLATQANGFVADHLTDTRMLHRRRLERLHDHDPGAACGLWLRLLFRPFARILRQGGLVIYPRLPGGVLVIRGRAPASAGHRELWFCAAVCDAEGAALGTLVTVSRHCADHYALCSMPLVVGMHSVGVDLLRRQLEGGSIEIGQWMGGRAGSLRPMADVPGEPKTLGSPDRVGSLPTASTGS